MWTHLLSTVNTATRMELQYQAQICVAVVLSSANHGFVPGVLSEMPGDVLGNTKHSHPVWYQYKILIRVQSIHHWYVEYRPDDPSLAQQWRPNTRTTTGYTGDTSHQWTAWESIGVFPKTSIHLEYIYIYIHSITGRNKEEPTIQSRIDPFCLNFSLVRILFFSPVAKTANLVDRIHCINGGSWYATGFRSSSCQWSGAHETGVSIPTPYVYCKTIPVTFLFIGICTFVGMCYFTRNSFTLSQSRYSQ